MAWGPAGKWPSHTNRLVKVFMQGPGSERLMAFTMTALDFERGPVQVVDNTAIFHILKAALPAPP